MEELRDLVIRARAGDLREPAAFPGWLRRILFKQCDRMTRRKHLETAPLDAAAGEAAPTADPAEHAERREMADKVLHAVRSLPEPQRMVTTLFYINGYSQDEIAGFLDVPVSTVKNRLLASRRRLKDSRPRGTRSARSGTLSARPSPTMRW